jgi:hypothetical protein
MKRLLLISGTQGSGKSTIAHYVRQAAHKDGYLTHVLKFADPLYEIHASAVKIMDSYGKKIPTPNRPLLQLIGTDWGRAYLGEDCWVDILVPRISSVLTDPKSIVVVDDVRFPNELAISKQFPTLSIRLDATEDARRNRAEKWGDTRHVSELSLDRTSGFDLVFDTTHAYLEDLGRQVWEIMRTKQ